MAQGRVVWGLGGPWARDQEGLEVVAWVAVTGCLRGASVTLGEVSSLAVVGAHWPVVAVCAEGCWLSKCMVQGGHLVWPGGVPGPGWSCCATGSPGPRPQKGFGAVAKVAVLAGLLGVPLQFFARGPRVRQWGRTGREEMRDGRVSWGRR